MGGQSTSQNQQQQQSQQSQNATQSSATAPWAQAQPAIGGILGQLYALTQQNQGVNGQQTGALNSIESNAQNGTQFMPQMNSTLSDLLNGGGANTQAPMINQSYQDYQRRLSPYANGSMVGNNPALQAQLDTIRSDVTNQVNGQFAGAGRDFSGMNQQTLARGIAQGEAPVIANQYNQDVGNQMNAAGSLYGAGNTTGGLLSGLNQQRLANQQAGVSLAPSVFNYQNAGPQSVLEAEAQRTGIPAQNLGLLAQLGIPIAGLGSQSSGTGSSSGMSSGTGTSNTTNQMSGADQFAKIAGGIGAMNPFRFVFGGK